VLRFPPHLTPWLAARSYSNPLSLWLSRTRLVYPLKS